MKSLALMKTLFLVCVLAYPALAFASYGPVTEGIDLEAYAQVTYVSAHADPDAGVGSRAAPLASLTQAVSDAWSPRRTAILVAEGVYEVANLELRSGLDLFGGFDEATWIRDVGANRTVIDAAGTGRVLIASGSARIDGFEVRGGLVRGHGAGILIDGASPVITNNVFTGNHTLAPEDWSPAHWHETAHDGGAIYCREGGVPEIRNNLIYANTTEIGRGAGIAFDGQCKGVIQGNVVMNNRAGLKDGMRSSDGGGISIFHASMPVIRDNLVLGNEALNSNDGGGIFVALWSAAKIHNNVLLGNRADDDAGGLFVGGQAHRYDRPLDPMPRKDAFFVEVTGNRFFGNTNASKNSGALRITMESRGLVKGNIAALNPGFYLQRSELEVVDNTIVEDLIVIETKQGLAPMEVRGNVLLGTLHTDGTANIFDNRRRASFLEDGIELPVLGVSYAAARAQTTLKVPDLGGADLTGRVAVDQCRWGLVESASEGRLSLWGDFRGATEIRILPTYQQTTSSVAFGFGADAARALSQFKPQRINRSIELLERGQPIYYASAYGGYDLGIRMAKTWADYIVYNMEHQPLDFGLLRAFMRGLVDAGPTPSGHRTPTVIVVLPLLGLDEMTVKSGGWMVQQALAQGVHGVHLARARNAQAVKRFVQAARYPVHKRGIDVLGEGLRGWGSHLFAAWVWGLDPKEYLTKADVWPLNPDGEIMLGVKIEDAQALANSAATLAVPGLAFAEHGPRDMGLSYGHLEGQADPPVPAEVSAAGDLVLALAQENSLFFLDNVLPENVIKQIERGVMIGAGRRQDSAEVGRAYSKREMPW